MNKSYMPWFVWNNENSYANGLWIKKLPDIVRAKERTKSITIPGRAGSLTVLEGEDIYNGYLKQCTVVTVNTNQKLQHILDWLRGSGNLIFCNEDQYVYRAYIDGQVSFTRDGNNLIEADIPFFVEPFKMERFPEGSQYKQTEADGTLFNPGNVASKPIVHIKRSGNVQVTINGQAMRFTHVSGTIDVDCDAQIILKDGALWGGSFEGEFWNLQPGTNTIHRDNECEITIEPRWRWV